MAGLTNEGFTPLTYNQIKERIEAKQEQFSPGFDFSPESPDGQIIGIMAFELAQAWSELGLVYHSYDPTYATGHGLINIGQITGIPYGSASRSYVFIDLTGVVGTEVPKGSLVTDSDGNVFETEFTAYIDSTVRAISQVAGNLSVPAGSVNTIQTYVEGWTGINQPADGVVGGLPQTETQYRNMRQATVMRNNIGIADTIQARLLELGIEQALVTNNPTNGPLPDGTPANNIHVTVGEVGIITDEAIAQVILNTNSVGTSTYGSTSVVLDDSQGLPQTVNFTKAVPVNIYAELNITFLANDVAGALEGIKQAVADGINALLAGEDVVWSRLFPLVTQFGEAQINTFTIGKSLVSLFAANVVIDKDEFAISSFADINVTVV